MRISKAINTGEGEAIYADGEHEALIRLNGKDESGHLTWDIHEHTKGVGHVSGCNLTTVEAFTTFEERGVPLDKGWIPRNQKG